MRSHLILHTTALAQWHALVETARQASAIVLSEELESYLVFLLMRFEKKPEMVNSILAVDFLQNIKKPRQQHLQNLREVGDKCLLFSGFFPEIAKKRRLKINYYVELGQSAYSSLSYYPHHQLSKLFGKLCQHFVSLMDILQTMKALDPNADTPDLLTAEELWRTTRSAYALKILRQATQGFCADSGFSLSPKKH